MSQFRPPTAEDRALAPRCGRISRRELEGFRISSFELRRGYRSEPHAHTYPGIAFVADGRLGADLGITTRSARSGGSFLLPAAVEHRERSGPQGSACVLVEVTAADAELARALQRSRTLCGVAAGAAERAALQAVGDSSPDAVGIACRELVLAISASVSIEQDEGSAPTWLRAVLDAVDLVASPCSLEELGDIAGVSPEHVARTFRRFVGWPVGEWRRRRRLLTAAEGLRRKGRSLSAIAHQCGYSDQSHMTRQFRRYLSTTPQGYRAKLL